RHTRCLSDWSSDVCSSDLGHKAGNKTFKVHIDGWNLLPYLTGQEKKSPRPGLIYFSDDGDLIALRFDNWKIVFLEQRAQGTLRRSEERRVGKECGSGWAGD